MESSSSKQFVSSELHTVLSGRMRPSVVGAPGPWSPSCGKQITPWNVSVLHGLPAPSHAAAFLAGRLTVQCRGGGVHVTFIVLNNGPKAQE